jgi:hypothetical protein
MKQLCVPGGIQDSRSGGAYGAVGGHGVLAYCFPLPEYRKLPHAGDY